MFTIVYQQTGGKICADVVAMKIATRYWKRHMTQVWTSQAEGGNYERPDTKLYISSDILFTAFRLLVKRGIIPVDEIAIFFIVDGVEMPSKIYPDNGGVEPWYDYGNVMSDMLMEMF